MSVRVPSVFVLSCVGSGLATALITRPRSLTECSTVHINSDGGKPEGLIRKVEEEEEEEKKKKNSIEEEYHMVVFSTRNLPNKSQECKSLT
jgi:hypothetical protein